ncbi:hypothetical protein PCANC_20915 [Puccinia coronata f. sp. avenae]|uniref:Uncharacterized protein n=1 Tax=Puccinia coronata f. sp. avenae TaxID=200324 RepID=A0A2N5SSZ2_9BASI|nr:hypothetical protein PCANC_20915 [Puccinia coronata f. sp. avenae]
MTSSSNQSQITVQFTTSKNASSEITTSKNASYFNMKGGLLTPFQHHLTRKNLPETTISLTTHPSNSPELTTNP